jgi:hypothetical protein
VARLCRTLHLLPCLWPGSPYRAAVRCVHFKCLSVKRFRKDVWCMQIKIRLRMPAISEYSQFVSVRTIKNHAVPCAPLEERYLLQARAACPYFESSRSRRSCSKIENELRPAGPGRSENPSKKLPQSTMISQHRETSLERLQTKTDHSKNSEFYDARIRANEESSVRGAGRLWRNAGQRKQAKG